jgi:AcrR family transcriptional regulator
MSRPAILHSLTSNDDLSPRARIRNAAIIEFGIHGVKGASIRGIAKAAGVSPGMVQHYFKTKDQLRQACDQHILDVFAQIYELGLRGRRIGEPDFVAGVLDLLAPSLKYIARLLLEGGDAANDIFAGMCEITERHLRQQGFGGLPPPESSDIRALAVVHTAAQMGALVFQDQMYQALGAERNDLATFQRITLARLELTSALLVDPVTLDAMRASVQQLNEVDPPPEL